MNRTQFTFYESFFKAVSRIKDDAERAYAYDAICAYALYGEEPGDELPDKVRSAVRSVSEEIEADIRRSEEGRRCPEYKAWRVSVYRRDDYTCRKCGARGVRLNAHHIKGYAMFPDLRYELSNGITLCEICHKKEHRRRK